MDPARGELARAADVVVVARVAAVDHGVARLEERAELGDRLLRDRPRRHHHPHGAGRLERLDELGGRRRACHALGLEGLDGVGADVGADAPVPVAHRAPHEVRTHASKTHHPELERRPRSHRRLPRSTI